MVWHELTVTAAQVKALLCGICKLVVREAMHLDTAANLMPSCEHVFCASCLEGRLELFRTGEALQCPVCRRLVRAVYADPFLDSFVLALLAQSARPPVAAQPEGTRTTLSSSRQRPSRSGTQQVGVCFTICIPTCPGALQIIGDATLQCLRMTAIRNDQDGNQLSQSRRMSSFANKHSQFQEQARTTSSPLP